MPQKVRHNLELLDELQRSNALGNASSFRDMIFPILEISSFDSFSFLNLFRFRVLHSSSLLHSLVLRLSPESICHLYFSQLLNRHRWHIVAWSEHLVLVLISQSNSLIDGVWMDICFLFWVLILRHDIQGTIIIHILRPHQVRNFIHTLFLKCAKNN